MTAGLGRTDGGSLTVDRNALVERWVETFGLDLSSPVEAALVVQEVAHVAGLVDAAVAGERERVRRLLAVPALNALRCVPDGEIRVGCVIHDGATVRERLRQAYLAVRDGDPAPGQSETSTGMPAQPAESPVEPRTGAADPSAHSEPRDGEMRAPRPGVPLPPATLPWEALDPDHGDHDDFVRRTGRCFAGDDCPRHNPKENPMTPTHPRGACGSGPLVPRDRGQLVPLTVKEATP